VSKFTPGPWQAQKGSVKIGFRYLYPQTVYGESHAERFQREDEDVANARLIAAAPEMLEALELALEAARGKPYAYNKIKAAIAKAKGGQ
jgi:hypothetical protein